MKIIIGGDLVPTKSNLDLFCSGDVATILGAELFNIWNDAEFRIFNLEAPITDTADIISKCGPVLSIPTAAIVGIKALNPSLVSLANNHILDKGNEGLFDTLHVLEKEKVPYVGAGKNVDTASIPFIIDYEGKKIGIFSCTEHEFSYATSCSSGANPYDPLTTYDQLELLSSKCDYVILLYHGGIEHFRYPSPELQRRCRKMIEKGVDLVICQHSHCIGCEEIYKNGKIIYGQGNFIFDYSDNDYWKSSLLLLIDISDKMTTEIIPFEKKEEKVLLSTGKEKDIIIANYFKRSSDIKMPGFIQNEYFKKADLNYERYCRSLAGTGRWISRIDRFLLRGIIARYKYSKENLLEVINFIECESHRELLIEALKRELISDDRNSIV